MISTHGKFPFQGTDNANSPQAASSPENGSLKSKSTIQRTTTGCRTCRFRRVKCDEEKPDCTPCRKGKRVCTWSEPGQKRARPLRRPNSTACDVCRDKKLKCVGDAQRPCERCSNMNLECHRGQSLSPLRSSNDLHTSSLPSALSSPFPQAPSLDRQGHESVDTALQDNDAISGQNPPGQLPTGKELDDLVQLFFSSVYHFGCFHFIHQLNFNRLLAKGKAPRELTLMMIATAVRFAGLPSPENLRRADAWADSALAALLPRIYQGFGAIQLMTLLLAQYYDLTRGNIASAWLLGSNCVRMMQMMSLQDFDRNYPANLTSNLRFSSLLSCEALRRVAWCTFYLDTVIDGGRYGAHLVDEKSFSLQLPCDQASFLANETVVTETLFHNTDESLNTSARYLERAPLDMSAYLIRTAAARRRALHFAYRASLKEETVERLSTDLLTLEADIESVIAALPKRFHFTTDNMFLHRDRLVTFILLHVLRHNLFIVHGRAALLIYQRDPAKVDLVTQVRRKRISHALPIAGLVWEGLKMGVNFDPSIGVHAYVALEILLFEPRRLSEVTPFMDPKAPDLTQAIPHLLTVIRNLAARSHFVKQLHVEAVHRLLRCSYTSLLNEGDLVAFRSEYRLVGQDAAEYDFRDFRWAKLERIRRGAQSSADAASNEVLLEYEVGGDTAANSSAPSPRLDAMDVNHRPWGSETAQQPHSSSTVLDVQKDPSMTQHWLGLTEPANIDQIFSLDSWFLDESGYAGYQSGDPTMFWNQLRQV